MHTADRIVTVVELLERIAPDRAAGRRVVFTNGCFDLLHAGHVSLLEQAAALGEILVVGVNTDDSVRRLKGPKRPIVPERERALVIASLRAVDYVVFFGQDTPLELITALVPDVLVKGEDYRHEEIVGHEVVEARGGSVVRVRLVEGVSTTHIFRRLWNEECGSGGPSAGTGQ